MDPIRTGKKLAPRDRKNGAAHEAWTKRKLAANSARPKQVLVVTAYTYDKSNPDHVAEIAGGHFERAAD